MRSDALLLLEGGSSLGPQWKPRRRAALPPLPQPVNYDHVLPAIPAKRDLGYVRSQFCGFRVPGAPLVPGASDRAPDLVMACLLDNYPERVQDQFLEGYALAGYTHLQRSVFHTLYYGGTLAKHNALSQRARSRYGLFCDQWFLGVREIQPGNQDAAYWRPRIQPIADSMLGAGVVDSACVGWQLDQWMQDSPGNKTIGLIAMIAEMLPSRIPLYTHWVNEALAWWKTGGELWSDRYQTIWVADRFSWWLAMRPYLTGGYHQGDCRMAMEDVRLYQDKIKDTLNAFRDGRMGMSRRSGKDEPFKLVGYEITGQWQFDGLVSEVDGDLRGLLVACTKSDHDGHGLDGYGNGARQPDGWNV